MDASCGGSATNVNLSLKIPGIPCPKHKPCSAVLSLPAVAKAPQPALLCLRKDHGKMRRFEARQHVPKGTSRLPANQESLTINIYIYIYIYIHTLELPRMQKMFPNIFSLEMAIFCQSCVFSVLLCFGYSSVTTLQETTGCLIVEACEYHVPSSLLNLANPLGRLDWRLVSYCERPALAACLVVAKSLQESNCLMPPLFSQITGTNC